MRLYKVGDKVKIRAKNRSGFTGIVINDRGIAVLGKTGLTENSYTVRLNESKETIEFLEREII